MICPACGFKNGEENDKCSACGMVLLKNSLVSINDIERYKSILVNKVIQNDDDFIIENKVLTSYIGEKESVTIPNSVEIIGDHCFTNAPYNNQIKEIIITSQVKCINSFSTRESAIKSNNGAFEWCQSLERVSFEGESLLEEIGYYAFYNCKNLKAIEGLPDHKVYIGRHAFCDCPKAIIKYIAKHKNYVFEDGWDE